MPAGPTYEPIATTTLGSATATVTFSSIPGTYTDLVLVANSKTSYSGSADAMTISFNGDTTGSNYSTTRMGGEGSGTGFSDRYSGLYLFGWTGTNFGATIGHINNYKNTSVYKTVLVNSKSNGTYGVAGVLATLWRNTNAITSLVVSDVSGNFQIGSMFTLYGIAAA